MNAAHLRFLADDSSSVLWRTEDLIRRGQSFEQAKAAAIAQAEPYWRGYSKETARQARFLAQQIAPVDLSKAVQRILADRMLADIEAHRGRRAGSIERLFYRITGLAF